MTALHFEGFDTQERAEELIQMLNALKIVSPEILERFNQIKQLLEFAEENYANPVRLVSMKYLSYAITQYVLGFLEASVYYSSLAVELMLFRSSIRKYGAKGLVQNLAQGKRSLSFKWLIWEAGILKDEDKKVADDMRKMRNCYVHFQNQLLFSEMGHLPDLGKFPGVSDEEKQEVMKIDRLLKERFDEIFPSHEELANKESLEFIRLRRKMIDKMAIETILNTSNAMNLSSIDPMELARKLENADALDTLTWCKNLLENPEYHLR